jgi:autotransporter-associated beta strand protein
MLTLTGANTYAGVTTVSAGALRVGNAGTTGGLAGNVVDNGELVFDRSDNLSYAGAISGTGKVTQQGAGVLTLSGANTYTGGTTLAGGTLNLGSAGAIWSSGAITFAGGVLQFSAANQTDYSSRFSAVANQIYRFDTNSQNVTLAARWAVRAAR